MWKSGENDFENQEKNAIIYVISSNTLGELSS